MNFCEHHKIKVYMSFHECMGCGIDICMMGECTNPATFNESGSHKMYCDEHIEYTATGAENVLGWILARMASQERLPDGERVFTFKVNDGTSIEFSVYLRGKWVSDEKFEITQTNVEIV